MRLLVKLRAEAAARALSATRMEPLYEPDSSFGAAGSDQWFVADLKGTDPSAWDVAHQELPAAMGLAPSDITFVEPDLVHSIYQDVNERPPGHQFALGENCDNTPSDGTGGKAIGPSSFAWHLDAQHSQLRAAREAVSFAAPRTRIAHLDTGYHRAHETVPAHILRSLERSFVEEDANPRSAEDPDRQVLLLDNSGHGTGTIGILAGAPSSLHSSAPLGAAPDAEILPLRVADRVVLLRTSALARAFRYAAEQRCDVVTLSMGGLPSQAWSEAVDELYEKGVCICAAAGNHVGVLPPRTLVYPARYARVIAVCGVMANGAPYANLKGKVLEGSHGPESAMGAAIAAFTPNIPWARFGCERAVRLDGQGTSAATPQVAAAAALWFEKHKAVLPRDWRRVEAVRHALFSTATSKSQRAFFGNGVVQARAALDVAPVLSLPKSARSVNSFAFLRLITGLGLAEPSPRERMFNLELAQRWLANPDLQALVPDPERLSRLSERELKQVMEAVIGDSGASAILRSHVSKRFPVVGGSSAPRTERTKRFVPEKAVACADAPPLRPPAHRRLRVYALDPSFSQRHATASSNEVTLPVRWEPLEPGPVGEYLRIEDVDGADTPHRYKPVDLENPRLLAQDGWAPSEGNPQFHQQMVYAVVMKTIEHFERALGRPVMWRPRLNLEDPFDDSGFVQQLLVRPHALPAANAHYSPSQGALLFGYFDADASDPGNHMPGSRIYSCLSHDIIAHETTHAVLDGIHRRFNEPTNPDVLAFHEAFADIVALLLHFSIPEVVAREIARSRGDLEGETTLGSLAVQFGRGIGGRGALREAIGGFDENGIWQRVQPDPRELARRKTPHSRGAILVAAVFDAFLACYKAATADLFRLATSGTGVLPSGAIHPDLAARLGHEASSVARRVLEMCIRAVDFLPPVDVTFFEYLRALITADMEVVSEDRLNFRVAFVEAFRGRGIYPLDLQTSASADTPRTLSVDTLRWQGVGEKLSKRKWEIVESEYTQIVEDLREFASRTLYINDRATLFAEARKARQRLQRRLTVACRRTPEFAKELGVDLNTPLEVHQIHQAMRVGRNGATIPQLIITLTQARPMAGTASGFFRGGSTLIVDLTVPAVKYRIVKNIDSKTRPARTLNFMAQADPLHRLMLLPDQREPFAMLHAIGEDLAN